MKEEAVSRTAAEGWSRWLHSESKKLADLVVDFLKLNGVPDNAIKIHYKGSDESIASNQTSLGRAANRRVEIRVIL